MAEESAAPSTSADKIESIDVDGEAKKLLGLGQKNLVMGDIPAAVNAFQEAASLLGEKYGETANECAEAFFFYGKSLLELARMENGVLGNALEGVQVEEEEKEEKTEDSLVESADNIDEEEREELREQVYNAMGEKDDSRRTAEEPTDQSEMEKQLKNKDIEIEQVKEEKEEPVVSVEDISFGEKEEEAIGQEKHGDKEVSSDGPLEDGALREEKPITTEKTAGEEEPAVTEEAMEGIAMKKAVDGDKEADETNPISEEAKEAASENIAEKYMPAEREERVVLENIKEEAGKLVVSASAKQEDKKEKNLVVEELVKTSGEEISKMELITAVEKIEPQVEKTKEQPHSASDDTREETDAVEQVVDLKEKGELKEPSTSEDVCFSTADETIPAEVIEQSHKAQTEEKAEVDAKVEKEEEKDDDMGEGEETEGSEEEDKAEDDKENESTIEEKESEEEEVGNLELAWDMLELAKVIYKRQDTKEAQLHAAQAHLKLGEVSIESENYLQAIEEFHSCLALQQKYLEAHDRLLAETHYHLGLAYHYNNQYDEAVQQFSKSVEVIDKRLVMLTARLKAKEEGSTDDEKEIEELKELLPEIKEKIEDSKESQKSARVAELALKATLVGGSSSSFSQETDSALASTIPVRQAADGASPCITDISHLVRKKRKPEEETQQGDNEAKKPKPEPAVNGGGDAAPSGNEVAEKMEEETEEKPHSETVQSAV